ncbi:hypothetical protein KCP73_08400 [Salmonella enterica subsp. enterica]|nr:hypothetical protein KCP73_08400 [Salmonella enterica subsp. enterica]
MSVRNSPLAAPYAGCHKPSEAGLGRSVPATRWTTAKPSGRVSAGWIS